MNNYLVIKTGYEGIEEIIGLFDEKSAIRKINALRSKDKEEADFYCVQKVSARGARCVCRKLGVKPSKTMWR